MRRTTENLSCEHENTQFITTGGMFFYGGDVDDDIEEHILCLDCNELVEDALLAAKQACIEHGFPVYFRTWNSQGQPVFSNQGVFPNFSVLSPWKVAWIVGKKE